MSFESTDVDDVEAASSDQVPVEAEVGDRETPPSSDPVESRARATPDPSDLDEVGLEGLDTEQESGSETATRTATTARRTG